MFVLFCIMHGIVSFLYTIIAIPVEIHTPPFVNTISNFPTREGVDLRDRTTDVDMYYNISTLCSFINILWCVDFQPEETSGHWLSLS